MGEIGSHEELDLQSSSLMPIAHGASESGCLCLLALDQVVDAEQNERSDEGHEEAGGLAGLVVADCTTKEGPDKRTCNADEHRNPDAAGVFAWNDEFCNRADDKTDEGRPKQTEHSCSSVLAFRGCRKPLNLMGKRILLPLADGVEECNFFLQ